MPNDITQATALSTKANKTLDTMRARIVKADDARTETMHKARAGQVAEAATEAATANRHAAECRHGVELAERTRRRWAR